VTVQDLNGAPTGVPNQAASLRMGTQVPTPQLMVGGTTARC